MQLLLLVAPSLVVVVLAGQGWHEGEGASAVPATDHDPTGHGMQLLPARPAVQIVTAGWGHCRGVFCKGALLQGHAVTAVELHRGFLPSKPPAHPSSLPQRQPLGPGLWCRWGRPGKGQSCRRQRRCPERRPSNWHRPAQHHTCLRARSVAPRVRGSVCVAAAVQPILGQLRAATGGLPARARLCQTAGWCQTHIEPWSS